MKIQLFTNRKNDIAIITRLSESEFERLQKSKFVVFFLGRQKKRKKKLSKVF